MNLKGKILGPFVSGKIENGDESEGQGRRGKKIELKRGRQMKSSSQKKKRKFLPASYYYRVRDKKKKIKEK